MAPAAAEKSQWMKCRDKTIEELGYERYQICQHIKSKDGQPSVIQITFLFRYAGEQDVTIWTSPSLIKSGQESSVDWFGADAPVGGNPEGTLWICMCNLLPLFSWVTFYFFFWILLKTGQRKKKKKGKMVVAETKEKHKKGKKTWKRTPLTVCSQCCSLGGTTML